MSISRLLLTASLCCWTVSACVCMPSRAGERCELERGHDACPSGLICQQTPDGGVCFVALGGACDKDAKDALCADDAGCAGEDPVCGGEGASCAQDKNNCAGELLCESDDDKHGQCALPLFITGRVTETGSNDPIEDADVLALDASGAALSRHATTGEDGRYRLAVPATRDALGVPVSATVTLAAGAADHQDFPGGLRASGALDLGDVTRDGDALVLSSDDTDVTLIALPAALRGRASVAGTVAAGEQRGGVLVVPEGDDSPSPSALSDIDGVFRLFNVPTGVTTVRGYRAGLVLAGAEIQVGNNDLHGVVLAQQEGAGATVSGTVTINADDGALTSVVLVPESTLSTAGAHGRTPRDLRAPLGQVLGVDGAFSIEGVPPGRYGVLAGGDADGLVRDPDPALANTQLPVVEVLEDAVAIDEPIALVQAITVVSPGADGAELVDAPPTFRFRGDDNDDGYRVEVLDAFDTLVWSIDVEASASGDVVSVPYAGPELDAGGFYRFSATSLRADVPVSTTEEHSGVFVIAQ